MIYIDPMRINLVLTTQVINRVKGKQARLAMIFIIHVK